MGLPDLRTQDVETVLAVRRCGSVTGAARELEVTPSQVSKSVARLEKQLHVTILSRTRRGMILSETGLRLVPYLEQIIACVRHLPMAKEGPGRQLTVAAPSSLITVFMPVIAAAQPELRLRGLQLPPSMIRHYAGQRLFELAFTSGEDTLPSSWEQAKLGVMRKSLFAAPALAAKLGPAPVPVDRLLEVPFVSPIYTSNGEFVPVDDDCPLSYSARTVGHQAQTLELALELAVRTQQLVFGPKLAARNYLDLGQLVEIPVEGWDIFEPLFIKYDTERIMSHSLQAILAALRQATQRLG